MFFWNSLAFSMIQCMLTIWFLVPLLFLHPAWTSVINWVKYCTWQSISIEQFSIVPSLQPQTIYFLLLWFLIILDISCKWNHIVFFFLCGTYFTQCNVLKANISSRMRQDFLPFKEVISHCMNIPHFPLFTHILMDI